MNEHPSIERTFIVSNTDLADPKEAANAFRYIFSVMLFPEDETERERWILANLIDLLYTKSEKQIEDLFSKYPDIAVKLFLQKERIIETANSATYARQSAYGQKDTKGSIAGYLLYFLSQPHISYLHQACVEYKMNEHRLNGDLLTPSLSTLKNNFDEFKHVSPLWAALHAYRKNYENVLVPGLRTDINTISLHHHKHLLYFLRISSFFRYHLTETLKQNTSEPLIENYDKVWNMVSEDNRPFPQEKMTLQEN